MYPFDNIFCVTVFWDLNQGLIRYGRRLAINLAIQHFKSLDLNTFLFKIVFSTCAFKVAIK